LMKIPDVRLPVCYHFHMGLETDQNFNDLFQEQYEKIPRIFRLSKKGLKISFVVLGILIVVALSVLSAFYSTGKTVVEPSFAGYERFYNTYDYRFMVAFVVIMTIFTLYTGWLVIVELFEKRAFKKASRLANMIFLSERHRDEVNRQNDRLFKRY